ncbi:MAG TPA: TIM-barrel domain-containing protein [Puia sp.]|nr:TIM-barrel domain-containing protein [Puia sp.]
MKRLFTIVVLLGFGRLAAQDVRVLPHGVRIVADGIVTEITCYGPATLRVLKYPVGGTVDKHSLSVVREPGGAEPLIDSSEGHVRIQTPAVLADFDRATGKLIFFDPLTKAILLGEKEQGAQFTPDLDAGKPNYIVRQAFRLDTGEAIYGLGQQQNGRLDQRYQRNMLVQANTKVSIPYFLSIKGYALFWDNYSPTLFTDNRQETSFESQVGHCIDYYFMRGATADSVIAQMRALTGQAPMMPLWTFGYVQSKERYKTQFELVDVVRKYRALHIPLDGIVQDWQYWGKDSNWNAMAFDTATYPRPAEMIDSIHRMNAHLFIVAWPGFGPWTPQYAELEKAHLLLHFATWPPKSGTLPYDVYSPEARDIYWRYLNKGIFSLNSDAWWLDSSEPDHLNEKESDFDLPTYLGSYRSVRNAFPLEHIRGVYEHQRATTALKRVSILTRSAFAGQQRYGANTWSGDIQSSWVSLRRQIPAGLNFSLTGIPYWNTDIGGFFATDFVGKGGIENPEFRELYCRWLEFGTFMPLMRSHGTQIPREIYNFGKAGDTAFDAIARFIRLRYRLLPYNYSVARQVTAHSGSIMRALVMDFPADRRVWDKGDEFLSGSSLLVAPVMAMGQRSSSVYLPAGASWFDLWTGARYAGGMDVDVATPLDRIPIFVKAGTILPWGPDVQYAAEKKWDNLEVRIYDGADGHFTLYEDTGDGYGYEAGAFTEIDFKWDDARRMLTIEDRRGGFPGMLTSRRFRVVLVDEHHGAGDSAATRVDKIVQYRGKKVSVKW